METLRIISRDSIPCIREVNHDGQVHNLGELRDFRWSDHLREFMPDATVFSVSWVRLLHGEVLEPHVHPIESMMIIYSGSGEMLGALQRPIAEGDVIVVPIGSPHGFVGGPDGLYALSIQFGEGLYTSPERPRVHFMAGDDLLDGLLAYNETRMREYVEGPLQRHFGRDVLEDSSNQAFQLWLQGVQRLRLTSRATCTDPRYLSAFQPHENEEAFSTTEGASRDAAMEAITAWFACQMYVLDNAEKVALVHLVIENATAAYKERATPNRSPHAAERQDVAGAKERSALVSTLLRSESPRTYARIKEVVAEAWDMMAAMTDRMTEVARGDRQRSHPAALSTSPPLSRSVGP